MFPADLIQGSYSNNGEYGWTRAQIPRVVEVLVAQRMGILGGEVWWVHRRLEVLIPQRRSETPFIYAWETRRRRDEPWHAFIQRAAAETVHIVQDWPGPDDLPTDLPGQILYNLTWLSEEDWSVLGSG